MRRRLVLVLSVGFVADAVPCAGAGDLGYPAAALGESAAQRLSFDGAPRLDSRPAPSKESKATEELKPSLDKHIARCFAKIDGLVLINGPCQVLTTEMSVTFELSATAAEAVHESAQHTAEPVIKRSPERGGKNAVPPHSQKLEPSGSLFRHNIPWLFLTFNTIILRDSHRSGYSHDLRPITASSVPTSVSTTRISSPLKGVDKFASW